MGLNLMPFFLPVADVQLFSCLLNPGGSHLLSSPSSPVCSLSVACTSS